MTNYGDVWMNEIYIAVDGDSIGKIIENYILSNELIELKSFSLQLQNDVVNIGKIIEENKGSLFLQGGDNLLGLIHTLRLNTVFEYVNNLNSIRKYHFSMGLGDTSLDAYLALKYAKLKNMSPIYFDNKKSTFLRYECP